MPDTSFATFLVLIVKSIGFPNKRCTIRFDHTTVKTFRTVRLLPRIANQIREKNTSLRTVYENDVFENLLEKVCY